MVLGHRVDPVADAGDHDAQQRQCLPRLLGEVHEDELRRGPGREPHLAVADVVLTRLQAAARWASAPEAVQAELPGILGRDACLRILHEAVHEPAVHDGLLDEQGGALRLGHPERAACDRRIEQLDQHP
jgi:hypothetical protein